MTQNTQLMIIPFEVSPTEYSVMIVLREGNIERIRAYDPVEIPLKHLPTQFAERTLKDVIVTYATDEDGAKAEALARAGKATEALRHLTHGYRFRPDRGDHDNPPELLGSSSS